MVARKMTRTDSTLLIYDSISWKFKAHIRVSVAFQKIQTGDGADEVNIGALRFWCDGDLSNASLMKIFSSLG